MADKKTEPKDCIPGIHCDVKNCVYNDEKENCYAHEIKVGPTFATNCIDTECATFKEK